MCGFIFQKKINNKELDKKQFKLASKLIFKRGPDNQSFYHDDNHNIFHARLNIIDLNTRSNQPMQFNDYHIVYNGEIYNFEKVRDELKQYFKFKTSSDTEVLLYSYIKWGEQMFKKIDGMYSFVIYNFKKNVVFFARDLFGQKPLYYFLDKNEIILSSEVKPILKLQKLKKINFEEKEINKYLNYNFYGDSNFTFFKDIFQVPAGTFGYFSKNKLTLKKIKNKIDKTKINEKKVFNLLKKEIKNHLISDVDVAILISDGIDSKSILDLSEKIYKKKLKLFNLEFENFDNSTFNKEYKSKYKKNLVTAKFYKKDLFKFLNKTSIVCEAPTLGLFTLGLMKLFKKIKNNNIKVVLNGQGVDEIFGGYNLIFKTFKKDQIYHPSGNILSNNNALYLKIKRVNFNSGDNFKSKRNKMAFISKIPKVLNQFDKISMNYSIENRSPYLTPDLAGIIEKLKLKQIYKKNKTKFIFRKVLYDFTKNNFYFNDKLYEQSPQPEFLLDKSNFLKTKKIVNKKNYCDKFFIKKNIIKYLNDFKTNKNSGFLIWQYLSLNSFLESFRKINFR
ncbi:asparagine synthase (glutamine-hydrolyzing) [Candidatus Pelagibacter sp.]|nr:asparagine synthase (glutamine-hydrolyzing) [Candidatus Pelagibacter sp.]